MRCPIATSRLIFSRRRRLIAVHLSRMAEELILWTSTEFGFAELPDEFSTGSSMMPQKKNPDLLELIRGKSGRVIGDLVAMLTILKGLPLAYNSDLQEDKERVFDAVDTIKPALDLVTKLWPRIRFKRAMMRAAAGGFALATDLAEYLVARGMPFRKAHEVVGALVRETGAANRSIAELTLRDLQRYSTLLRSRRDRRADGGKFDARAQADRRSGTGYCAPAAEGARARMIHQAV